MQRKGDLGCTGRKEGEWPVVPSVGAASPSWEQLH